MALTGVAAGPVQAPVASGDPPSCANSENGAAVPHTLMAPLVPASGGLFTVTVTVADAVRQGVVPVTV